MTALNRKLVRDLWQMRAQALAIAMVVTGGVGLYVTMRSTLDSLDLTLNTYYARNRFGDVFASARRAPLSLGRDIESIPGVSAAELRVVADVTLDMPSLADPVVGHLISVPADRRPRLNDIFIREGRYLEPGRVDEALVSEAFARIHGLRPGGTVTALINGRRRVLNVVGIAMSPEFIYTIRTGEILPDDTRFGVLWIERRALAAAFDMEGGFNDVVLDIEPGASEAEVSRRLDDLLEPYGGLGAIPRALQTSHWYLANELRQLRNMGQFIPMVFLAVAAFLVNVVLSRIVAVQREQIAALKALGYGNGAVATHYIGWSFAVAFVGTMMGVALGAVLGSAMTRLYTAFFQFPLLLYRLLPATIVQAAAIGFAAAGLGAAAAVQRAVSLPPAEAMRPEPPARYRPSVVERGWVRRFLSQPARMMFRNIERHPLRSLLSATGIALACSLLVVGSFSMDSMDEMMDTQFNVAQRYDVYVTFVLPASSRAFYEVGRLPGVLAVEPSRTVPVRLRHGPRFRYTAITALVRDADLNRPVDMNKRVIEAPASGLLLSTTLARQIDARPGDTVIAEVLEGRRPAHELVVASVVDDLLGASAYMDRGVLARLMQEDGTLSGAYLMIDRSESDALYARLKAMPGVAAVVLKEAAYESIMKTMGEMMLQMQAMNILFAAIIAFGVVYNTARISLSERSRELATLRVIGFTRGEISYILLGELAIVTLAAIPLGLAAGYFFAHLMATAFSTDLFRLPLVVSGATYTFAAVTIAIATVISALVVRRKLDRLDLVAVLKTRE
ncbi:MAG: ABC transporter permease [Vicinamibacterales bacterium]